MSDRRIDLVEEGVDVAIRIVAGLGNVGLVARKLASDRTVVCAAPAYLARRGTPASADDLLSHDCLIYTLVKNTDEWRFRAPNRKETFGLPVKGRFATASGTVLRQAAVAGMGLAVLPTFMVAGELAAGRLRTVLDEEFAGTALGIHAVYPQGPRPPSKVRALVDLLVGHFRTPPWTRAGG